MHIGFLWYLDIVAISLDPTKNEMNSFILEQKWKNLEQKSFDKKGGKSVNFILVPSHSWLGVNGLFSPSWTSSWQIGDVPRFSGLFFFLDGFLSSLLMAVEKKAASLWKVSLSKTTINTKIHSLSSRTFHYSQKRKRNQQ